MEGATSDLSFEARGETLEALFAAAAEALLAATLSNPADVAPSERVPVSLSEPDLELLLLRFLNELVFLRDARGLLLRAGPLRIAQAGEARLEGELVGERIDPRAPPARGRREGRHRTWAPRRARRRGLAGLGHARRLSRRSASKRSAQ